MILLTGEILIMHKLRPEKNISGSIVVLASPVFLLAIVVGSAVAITPSPIGQIDRILSDTRPTGVYVDKAITGIKELTTEDDVVLFALHDGRSLAARAGRHDRFPYNSSVATGVHRGQVTAIVQAALGSKAIVAVIWAPCCTPGPTLDALRVMDFQIAGFHDTGVGEGKAGPLVLRSKSGPSGIRSGINNAVRVSAIQSALQTVIPSRAQTAYWFESVSGEKTKIEYPNLTVVNSIYRMPDGDVVLAGARYLNLDGTSLSTAGWTGFVERRTSSGELTWNSDLVDQVRSSIFKISTTESGELLVTGLRGIDTTVGAESPLSLSMSASDGKVMN